MESNYNELTIKLNSDFVEIVADFIGNIHNDGLELGSDFIVVRSPNDLQNIIDEIESLNNDLNGTLNLEITQESKENIDWIKQYQDSIEPIEAGKFYIFPSWYEEKEHLINIKIDPALAFGSGHHATTFSCLNAISKYVSPNQEIIDVGCGSGILGLACRKLGADIDLCDTDPLSVKSCKENFELNNETFNELWEGSINKADKKYDIVIANIIADVLKLLSKDIINSCKDDGQIILSGILNTKEDVVLNAFSSLQLEEKILKDEWVTLIYNK